MLTFFDFLATDLIIDGLLGFGLKGPLKSPYNDIITFINSRSKSTILSIDLPSGLNATTGESDVAIKSDATISFGAPKKGFLSDTGRALIGRLLIADIGIPHRLYKRLKEPNFPRFNSGRFVEVFF